MRVIQGLRAITGAEAAQRCGGGEWVQGHFYIGRNSDGQTLRDLRDVDFALEGGSREVVCAEGPRGRAFILRAARSRTSLQAAPFTGLGWRIGPIPFAFDGADRSSRDQRVHGCCNGQTTPNIPGKCTPPVGYEITQRKVGVCVGKKKH